MQPTCYNVATLGKPSGASLNSSTSKHENTQDIADQPIWHGFSVKTEENLRFLHTMVSRSRNQVVGSNHLGKDIRLKHPDSRMLNPEAIMEQYEASMQQYEAIMQQHGQKGVYDFILIRDSMEKIVRKLKEFSEKKRLTPNPSCQSGSTPARTEDTSSKTPSGSENRGILPFYKQKIEQFCVEYGFGECGPQCRQCLINLLNAGVPSQDLWQIVMAQLNDRTRSHSLILVASKDDLIAYLTYLNDDVRKRSKGECGYDHCNDILKINPLIFFDRANQNLKSPCFIVDPFFNRVILLSELFNSEEFSDFRDYLGTYEVIYPVRNLDMNPIEVNDISDYKREINTDEKTKFSLNTIQSVVHRIKLRELIAAAELTKKQVDLLTSSVNNEEYNLAFRQSAFCRDKANAIFDYLFDHRCELSIEINAKGKSGKNALRYAQDSDNSHAISRLLSMN